MASYLTNDIEVEDVAATSTGPPARDHLVLGTSKTYDIPAHAYMNGVGVAEY